MIQFLVLFLSISAFSDVTLTNLKGLVKVNDKEVVEGAVAKSKDTISAEGKGSSVQITFDDKSRTLLRNGKLVIREDDIEKKSIISLLGGIIFVSKEKSQRDLIVKTKFAVMGIRGTKFFVEEKETDSYLCVCEGAVEIQNLKSTAIVEKDEDVMVSLGKPFKKTSAKKEMRQIAREGFIEMGVLK